jgi:hypothetical protein
MKMTSKRILVAAVAATLSCTAFAATDPVLEKLSAQVAELQKQIADLKAAQAKDSEARQELANQVEAQGKEAVLKGDTPGSFRRAGEETSVHVYGFARLDAVHNFGGRNNASTGDYAAYQPAIALSGSSDSARRGETYMFTKTSRLGVESFTPTALGSLTTKVEADFYNTTGSGLFRLRHAYGQLGAWTVGQTWSTFMDLDSTPETVDFNGATGNTSLRQPQIRYTYVTPSVGNFIAAIETKANGGNTSGDEMNRTPDLVLRWEKMGDWGSVSVRGVTTENAIKSDSTTAAKRGYGIGVGSSYKFTDTTTFMASSEYGQGMGRFFNESVGAQNDSTASKVYLPTELGFVVGLQQKFTDTLRASMTYGQQRTLGSDYVKYSNDNSLTVNRAVKSGTIGVFWTPVANVELGSEFMLSHRETLDGRSGTEPRLNFAATYAFGN